MSRLRNYTFLLIVTLLLSACAGGTGQPAPTPTATAVPANPTPAPTVAPDTYADVDPSGQTVIVWHSWNPQSLAAFEQLVADFNAQNEYAITVEAKRYDTGAKLSKAVNAGLKDGALPNIAVGYASQYRGWGANGIPLLDLTPMVTSASYGLSQELIEDYYPAIWASDVYGDERYGMPALRYGQVLYYNQRWAQELGFSEAPSNTEEFRQQACAAAAANGDGTGGLILNHSASAMLAWLGAYGAKIEVEGGGYYFNTGEVSQAFEFLADLYAQGCAWQPEAKYPNVEFASRKGLFYTASISGIPYQFDAMAEYGSRDPWTAIPFPAPVGQPAVSLYGSSYVVIETTPEADLATWLFIKYLQQPENQLPWLRSNYAFALQRSVAMDFMALSSVAPQLAGAMQLAEYGQNEPRQVSWSAVYGALEDAGEHLFTEDYDPESLPLLLQDLQAAADEIQAATRE